MTKRRGLRAVVLAALVVGTVLVPSSAQSQAPRTVLEIAFSGVADVKAINPPDPTRAGIYLPGLDDTSNTAWRWDFKSSLTCQGTGISGGTPAAGACSLVSGGPLKGDLTNPGQPLNGLLKDAPYCGNSTGFTDASKPATLQDPTGRLWSGEVHWDGVGRGDPSYSLGSQLYLWGTMTSGSERAQITLFLNASGGTNCVPQVSRGGATSFTVNGEGTLRTI